MTGADHGGLYTKTLLKSMVPTARLELAQLSPLPPQDSVSTNFTTSAKQAVSTHSSEAFGLREDLLTEDFHSKPKNVVS
jgi:hypothetical protein